MILMIKKYESIFLKEEYMKIIIITIFNKFFNINLIIFKLINDAKYEYDE